MQGKERKQEEVYLLNTIFDIPFVVFVFLCEEYMYLSLSLILEGQVSQYLSMLYGFVFRHCTN